MNPEKKYKLLITYDGTHYSGWQIQPHSLSIQEVIEKTLQKFLKKEIRLIASGRTDAGVHALGQVAHFRYPEEIEFDLFLKASNALLPSDIRIQAIESVPLHFHAQHSAVSKTYHYHLWLERVQSPFHRLYSYHVHYPVDMSLLKEAASCFLGTHDFTSFTNSPNKGSASRDAVRTIMRLEMILQEGGLRLEFEGNGFLYKMVRNIVGTLLEVASGKRKIEDISSIFSARKRPDAGRAVPPQGLCLMHVNY